MALLPYTKRVASTRAPRRGEEDGYGERPNRRRPDAENALVDTYADVIEAEVAATETPATEVAASTEEA
jgi:hypothetical protein